MSIGFLSQAYYGSALAHWSLGRRRAKGLHPLALDLLPGAPAAGRDILDGTFMLAGRRWPLGKTPFETGLESAAARDDLHGFQWLRDLNALGVSQGGERARTLVRAWLDAHAKWAADIWAPPVTASRMLSWITAGSLLADQSDGLGDDIMASLARQAGHLLRSLSRQTKAAAPPFSACEEAAAVVAAALALDGFDDVLERGLDALDAALGHEILSDGGHVSRSPERHLRTLARLAALKAALKAKGREVPFALQGAIDRMAPVLRSFRLGDGGLATFNGTTEGMATAIAHLRDALGQRAMPLNAMPQTGFERLTGGRTVIVADSGGPNRAHRPFAGMLAFEMSAGRHRIVVNCGAHPDETSPWYEPLRTTAAHSTVVVDDTNAMALGTGRISGRAEGLSTGCRRSEREGSTLVQMGHAGYARRFGRHVSRDLYLSGAGDDIRGKDVLTGDRPKLKGEAFAVRFHLHPEVRASRLDNGNVLMRPPDGRGWRFRAQGGDVLLEESIYFATPLEPRRSQQIVVSGPLARRDTTVKWSFRREGA